MFPHEPRNAALPVNYEAEQGLLGALLTNNAVFEQVADFLEPHHFGDPVHARIFQAIRDALIAGRQADARTLRPYLEADFPYLLKLTSGATVMVDGSEYGRRIFDDWRARQIDALADRMKEGVRTLSLDADIAELVAQAEGDLWELDRDHAAAQAGPEHCTAGVDRYLEHADRALKADGALIGITTGISPLDEALGGLHPTDLIVLAARPGMGKTALACNISRAAAEAGHQVLFFSHEMSAEQLTGRILAERSGITTDRVRKGQIQSREMGMLVAASGWLKALPLSIDDSSRLSTAQILARARRHRRRHGLSLIVVDYLQLVKGEGNGRTEQVTQITGDLKAIAKDLKVPMLALSQLSREVERRDDKRPTPADLRDSGSIEQDADVILFLYREAQYLSKKEPKKTLEVGEADFNARTADWHALMAEVDGKAEAIIGKNRHGPERTVHLRFDGARQRFSDPDGSDERQGSMLESGHEMAEQRG